MAGTQRRGDTPKFRKREVENRQPFRAEHVSLGEGLRSAFAHENRGPTPQQAAAIRAEREAHEQREEQRERRLEAEQERRRQLVLQDRLERERRAQGELSAKQRQREEQERQSRSLTGRNRDERSVSAVHRTTPYTVHPPANLSAVGEYMPPPEGTIPGLISRRSAPPLNLQHVQHGTPSVSRAMEPRVIHGSSTEGNRDWHVMEPGRGAPPAPPAVQAAQERPPAFSGASVFMVPQESHNVEERLFAARPSFTTKAQRRDSEPPPPQPLQSQARSFSPQPPAHAHSSPPQLPRPPQLPQTGGASSLGTLAPASQSPQQPQGGLQGEHGQQGQLRPASNPAAVKASPGAPAGIGISFVPDQDGNLLIAHLVPGGPAFLSGQLFVGDRLLSVSGQPVAGKSVPEIIRMVLGPKGTEVSAQRKGGGGGGA